MFGRTNRPSLGQYDFTLREPIFNSMPSRSRANSRFREVDPPLQNLENIQDDSSSSEDEVVSKPKPKTISKHSRSMSHPFPSLFSTKKKKNATADEFDVDDDTDDHGHHTKIYSSSSQAANSSRVNLGPVDFATGNCMTCAGLVRWPKDLQVFRCTKCLTINDTKPFTPPSRSRATIRAVPPTPSRTPSAGPSPLGIPANLRLSPEFILNRVDR
jgi:E3 ubiquitin-protein ligase HECTD2